MTAYLVYSHVWSWQAGRCSWAARCGTWPTCMNSSFNPSIYLPIHSSIYRCIYLSIHPPIYLPIYPSTHLSTYLSIHPPPVYSRGWSWQAGQCSWAARCGTWPTCMNSSFNQSIYLSTHLSTCTYLSIHLQSTHMYRVDRQVDVVEQLAVVLDWHAWIKHSIHLFCLSYPSTMYVSYPSLSTYLSIHPPSVYSHG